MDLDKLNAQIEEASKPINRIREETAKVIVGQEYMIDRLLLGLLTKGHVLLEGLPGLAKTLAIKTLSETISAQFSRIQFTPDLLPADIVGTMIYNPADNDFSVRKGPIFANFVLADEINRAPAKVQSALLEAMQERQVTIGKETYRLEEPFLVLATQNPIEQEGTYPLPEAQTDRFMLKLEIGYPSMEEEHQIVLRNLEPNFDEVSAVATPKEILAARKLVREVYLDEKVRSYIIDLVFATRNPEAYGLADLKPLIRYGGSPRASINLAKVSKAHAFLSGRGYVTPEDVREMIMDVMRHRLGLTYEAEAENIKAADVINRVLNVVAVP
ncbi:MAG: MoxR family ATPase [Bacteroidota bacterium]